ncbi:hypothetical protein Bca52824_015374 [Brassica carinata]|uniref:FKB95-like N-terminal Kelch domain-containing protein n=1 Tax=Brassica carinata TaxID=52824 RepID=A0A8X7W1Z5_BRACI|nr:hypothetical protein Bca52824_015374 [Brassica carinata]
MPRYGSFAAVGSRIYVFDGIKSYFIDCRSHTMQHLPSMPVHMHYTVADVSSGRIYVFGFLGTYPDWSYAMLVFDTETKTWEGPMTVPVMQIGYGCLVVMADKMYMTDFENSFVYDPKESKWETEEMLNSKSWQYPCVVDDVLYYYDWSDRVLREYDSEHKCWQVVKEIIGEICFAKISMQRCKGQIWGKVDQWCDHGLIAVNKQLSSRVPPVTVEAYVNGGAFHWYEDFQGHIKRLHSCSKFTEHARSTELEVVNLVLSSLARMVLSALRLWILLEHCHSLILRSLQHHLRSKEKLVK